MMNRKQIWRHALLMLVVIGSWAIIGCQTTPPVTTTTLDNSGSKASNAPTSTSTAPSNTASPIPGNSASTDTGLDGETSPPAYFEFSSEAQVSPAKIKELTAKYGSNVLIGGDPNHDDFWNTMNAAKAARTRMHVYLEGPGGPTGSKIDDDEYQRMKDGAKSVGIDTSVSGWESKWNSGGWLIFTRQQIQSYESKGFSSVEIDNLYRGIGKGTGALIAFLKEHQAWLANKGLRSTLLLKNITPEEWQAIAAEIKSGGLSRERFSDFSISEEDFSAADKARQRELSAGLGIQTLDSSDTHAYAVKGEYQIRR